MPERVVRDFSANGQVAARHLVDRIEQVGDAALERILRLLVRHGMGDFRGAAVAILSDEREFVAGFNFSARTRITRASRSENFASSSTGFSTRLLSTQTTEMHARIASATCAKQRGTRASARRSAIRRLRRRMHSGVIGEHQDSEIAAALIQTISSQTVELKRAFMTSSPSTLKLARPRRAVKSQEPETHPSSASNQQPAPTGRRVATFRGNAVRHSATGRAGLLRWPSTFRSLRRHDTNPQIVALRIAFKRRDDHVLRQQTRPPYFRKRDID